MSDKYEFKSERMSLDFVSVAVAERIKPRPTWALVSVYDTDAEPNINYSQWSHSLRLSFDDVQDPEDGKMFTPEMAEQLIEFAVSLPDSVDFVLVHCHAGISRSGAIVKFLAKYVFKDCFNGDFDRDYHAYNKRVYQQLARTWRIRHYKLKQASQ